MILALQTSLSLENQGGIASQTCTSQIYFSTKEIVPVDVLLIFSFKRMIYKEIRWCGHPPAAVSPKCRIHTSNNLFGMLPAKDWAWHGYRNIAIPLWCRTFIGKFEKILASGEPQSELHYSLSPLIQSSFLFLLLQMSDLHRISKSLPPNSCSHIPVILTVFPKVFPFDACFLEEPNEHASSNLMDADFDISSQMIWTF